MNSVNASLLQAMRSLFFPKTGGIACKCFGKLCFRYNCIYKFTDHRMLRGSDQIQIFPFYLIHHRIHFRKAHHTGYHIASDHKGRDTISKSPVYHKIPCIGNYGRVKSGNISHQIIKSVSGNLSGTVQINTAELLHYFRMIRDVKLRNYRITILFNLHILSIILTNRNARIYYVRDYHHYFRNLFFQLFFFFFQFNKAFCSGRHLSLLFLRLLLFTLRHQGADFLGNFVSVCPKIVRFLFCLPALCIESNHFIHQWKLSVLEFLFHIFFYCFRVFSQKFNVYHNKTPLCLKIILSNSHCHIKCLFFFFSE